MAILLVLIILIVVVGIIFVVLYNGLVALRNKVEAAWSQIDVQLKRRHDLVPNLVAVAKRYLEHEAQTLEAVVATPAISTARRVCLKTDISAPPRARSEPFSPRPCGP